jgi:hypothetical protein
MKLKTAIAALGAVTIFAIPATTMAAPADPATGWQFKDNTTYTDIPNLVGRYDAQITHNGWSVGGNKHTPAVNSVSDGADQTTKPGSRADQVQSALGH